MKRCKVCNNVGSLAIEVKGVMTTVNCPECALRKKPKRQVVLEDDSFEEALEVRVVKKTNYRTEHKRNQREIDRLEKQAEEPLVD